MNMNDFDSADFQNARMNRESRMNPPQSDPGMDELDSDWATDDSLGNSFDNSSAIGGGWADQMNGGNIGYNAWGTPQNTIDTTAPKSDEDKFWSVCAKGFEYLKTFFTEFFTSFKSWNCNCRMNYFWITLVEAGIAIIILTIAKLAFGFDNFLRGLSGVLLGFAPSPFIFMSAFDERQKNGNPDEVPDSDLPEESNFNNFNESDGFDDFPESEEEDEFPEPEDEYEDVDEYDPFSAIDEFEPTEDNTDITGNMNTILDAVNIDKGMVTRQYLYEQVINCLKSTNKNFDKVREIDEESEEFDYWDNIIQSCGETLKTGSSEDIPYLISAREKLFYVSLEVQRVKWIKNIQAFVDEIVNMYSFDPNTQKKKPGVYGLGEAIGNSIFIKIMKGESAFVSLKDTYDRIKDDILDTKNFMPVVFGIGQEGEVIWRDLKKINSMLVSGMPRSGKSWFIKCMLAQMMFWMKPSELQFLLLDPKGDISDFTAIKTPHIRKFVSSDKEIVEELRYLVTTEADRRRKILKDAGGFIDFWDLKRVRPDIEFPILYVVIDEVVTLADRMDKDTKNEFQGLLAQFVSQLPALGLRMFMIPHVVKDQIIKKTVTDLIPCRISVCGDAQHIESSTGAKPKDFPQKLTHTGDMAVKLNNDDVIFVHGAVLSDTNEGVSELFDFLARFWGKIEPESVENSIMRKQITSSNDKDKEIHRVTVQERKTLDKADYEALLQKANDTDDDDYDLDMDLF